jgi:hypothetical protein
LKESVAAVTFSTELFPTAVGVCLGLAVSAAWLRSAASPADRAAAVNAAIMNGYVLFTRDGLYDMMGLLLQGFPAELRNELGVGRYRPNRIPALNQKCITE